MRCLINRLVSMCLLFFMGFNLIGFSKPLNAFTSSNQELKLFAVEIKVGDNWDKSKAAHEQAFFKEHSSNLKDLRQAGFIVMGARYSEIGLIVFSATSVDEVKKLMDKDPSMSAGTFKYQVYPMNVFYPGLVKKPAKD